MHTSRLSCQTSFANNQSHNRCSVHLVELHDATTPFLSQQIHSWDALVFVDYYDYVDSNHFRCFGIQFVGFPLWPVYCRENTLEYWCCSLVYSFDFVSWERYVFRLYVFYVSCLVYFLGSDFVAIIYPEVFVLQ